MREFFSQTMFYGLLCEDCAIRCDSHHQSIVWRKHRRLWPLNAVNPILIFYQPSCNPAVKLNDRLLWPLNIVNPNPRSLQGSLHLFRPWCLPLNFDPRLSLPAVTDLPTPWHCGCMHYTVTYLHRSYPHSYWGMEVWRPHRNITRTQGIMEYTNHQTYPISRGKPPKLKTQNWKTAWPSRSTFKNFKETWGLFSVIPWAGHLKRGVITLDPTYWRYCNRSYAYLCSTVY